MAAAPAETVAQIVEQTRTSLERRPRRPAERPRVEPVEGPRQGRRVDGAGGVGDGPLRADVQARRGEQLGDVGGEQQIGGGDLAEAEVDEPDLTVVVEEDVRQPEVTMGDPVPAQLDRRGARSRRARHR